MPPSESRRLRVVMSLRLSPAEDRFIHSVAVAHGTTSAAYVRALIDREIVIAAENANRTSDVVAAIANEEFDEGIALANELASHARIEFDHEGLPELPRWRVV